MTYSRGQYDDDYERDRRSRHDASEGRSERRTGAGSSRYSRTSERYARHASAQRDERYSEGRPQSRPKRQRPEDSSRVRQRSRQDVDYDTSRSGNRRSGRRPAVHEEQRGERRNRNNVRADRAYEPRDNRQRDMRQRDARPAQHAVPRAGQRSVNQATQYSRDRYVSQPGQQRGTSVSQQNYDKARRVKPIDPRAILASGVIAVILLAVIVVRFIAFGGVASEYGAAKAAIDEQQTQLTELQTSNGELQAEMDSMQGLIDRYNNSGKK